MGTIAARYHRREASIEKLVPWRHTDADLDV